MSDYVPLDISCTNCGKPLSARRERNPRGFSIKGLHPLSYIHTESGSATCTRVCPARPYDSWTASAAYDKALKAREPDQ